jgi:hypothetical protein
MPALTEPALLPLPLGSLKPRGWLLEDLVLIPCGCTTLRVTEFPWVN